MAKPVLAALERANNTVEQEEALTLVPPKDPAFLWLERPRDPALQAFLGLEQSRDTVLQAVFAVLDLAYLANSPSHPMAAS